MVVQELYKAETVPSHFRIPLSIAIWRDGQNIPAKEQKARAHSSHEEAMILSQFSNPVQGREADSQDGYSFFTSLLQILPYDPGYGFGQKWRNCIPHLPHL